MFLISRLPSTWEWPRLTGVEPPPRGIDITPLKNHKLCTTIKYQKDKYLPPGNGHTWLKWHLHPVTFQSHVNQPHCNVLGLVEQAQVSMVTILQKRPSGASYGSCLPFKGLKPVLQKLQIMEQVLKWYILIFFYIKFLKLILNII